MMFRTMLVAGLMMASSAVALAQGAQGGGDPAARRARHQQRIAAYDKNHDGKLDEAERAIARRDRIAKRFAMLDADRNGSVSFAEFKKMRMDHRGRGHHGRRRFRCGTEGRVERSAAPQIAPTSLIY